MLCEDDDVLMGPFTSAREIYPGLVKRCARLVVTPPRPIGHRS